MRDRGRDDDGGWVGSKREIRVVMMMVVGFEREREKQ